MNKKIILLFIFLILFTFCGIDDFESPTVENTIPDDGATNISVSTNISITFSESMDAATVQANYNNIQPTGSVQLSSDGFKTVVRMAGGTASNQNKTYTFSPMLDLDSNKTYNLKVTTDAQDVAGNPLENEFLISFITG